MAKQYRQQAGFSLVEMAVVLIVIGLIAGGALKGQDLIQSARLNSVQVQADELRTATRTFYKKWGGWPGDISATDAARIGNVGGMPAGTAGLGDGMINGERLGTTADEPTWYWQHLRAAGLLAGIPVITTGSLTPEQALQSRTGGIWTFDWVAGTLISSNPTFGVSDADHWFLLGARSSATKNHVPVLTPSQLRSIDLKADDGLPNTGNIIGGNETAMTCKSGTSATAPYATGNAISCAAWFRL